MSIFPTRILLATDGSEDAELAASAAIRLANETGSELHVVYVGEFASPPHDYPGSRLEQIVEHVTHRTRSLLGERIGLIAAAGGDVSGEHVRVGRPADEIVALAEEIGAGLIVVGSRGMGGVRRALVGSISDSVVRHAHCPVMVVRGGEEGQQVFSSHKILLATDGSEEATLAARSAVDIADKTGSVLHVVHARLMLPFAGYPSAETSTSRSTSDEEEARQRATRWLEDQVWRIEAQGGKVAKAHLRLGRPEEGIITVAEEIVSLAEEIGAGLIVVGSRGLGGMRRALMGSISDSVVRHAHCPVLVVRKDKTG